MATTNPFAGAFGQEDPELQRMLQAMMQQSMAQMGAPPAPVPPMRPPTPQQGMSPMRPPGAPQGTPQLNPEAVAELQALSNRETRGLSDVMDVQTGDPGTALAKALTAHMLRKKQKERNVKEEAPLRKALTRKQREIDKDRELRLGREETEEARKIAQEAREVSEEGRRVQEETRAGQLHPGEMSQQLESEERLFQSTHPDLKPGSTEYGTQFDEWLKEYEQYSGYSSSGGYVGRARQMMNLWDETHPKESFESEEAWRKARQKESESVLANYRSFDYAGVETDIGTGGDVIADETPPEQRETVIEHETAMANAGEAGKLMAQDLQGSLDEVAGMREQITKVNELLKDPRFDDAVGWFDGWIGQLTQNLPWDTDGQLGAQIEFMANEVLLENAAYLEGNLSVKELETLQDSKPKRGSDEKIWRAWFARLNTAMQRANDKALVKAARTGGEGVRVPPTPGEKEEERIRINF